MRAGQLRHRVEIQKPEEEQSASGEMEVTWHTSNWSWADIRPLSGREYFAAEQVNADITHEIIMRHDPTLTVKHRIRHGLRVFELNAILNEGERDRMLRIMAKEVASVEAV